MSLTENAKMRAAINARQDVERENGAAKAHDEALARLTYTHQDLFNDPHSLVRVKQERDRMKDEAVKSGSVIDWDEAYPRIGNKVRAERRQ